MNKYSFVYSKCAETDLRNILDYIAINLQNPKAAKNLLLAIDEKIANICKEPELYSPCLYAPLFSQNVRFALVKKYKIYFTANQANKRVEILYIKHCLQDESKLKS